MTHRAIKLWFVIFILVALVALGAAGYYWGRVKPLIRAGKQEGIFASASVRPSVIGFGFEIGNGAHRTIADLKGKVVLVDVWAAWCGTCLESIPGIIALRNKYLNKPVEVIGLDVDDDGWAKVNPFLQKHPEINYTMAVPYPPSSFLLQSIVDLKPLGSVSAIPTFFVVDMKGRLAGKFVEHGHEPEIDELIARLLNE
jgi:thiol-disulfide isomerase/thioredoxin